MKTLAIELTRLEYVMSQSEIAKQVGISQVVVSMVLNDPETNKVLKGKNQLFTNFLKKSNYLNHSRALNTLNIGYVMNKYQNNKSLLSHRLIARIEEFLELIGYSLLGRSFCSNTPNIVKIHEVDGIIHSENLQNHDSLITIILPNRAEHKMHCGTVTPDNFGAIHLAVEHSNC